MAQQTDLDQSLNEIVSGETPAPFDIFSRVTILEEEAGDSVRKDFADDTGGNVVGAVSLEHIGQTTRYMSSKTVLSVHEDAPQHVETPIPTATPQDDGFMTAEQAALLEQHDGDIETLKSAVGKWIGRDFATKAALDAWVAQGIPAAVAAGDFTDVTDDESREGHHTRYACVITEGEKAFAYRFVVTVDPIAVIGNGTKGVGKGVADTAANAGKIVAGEDGVMYVAQFAELVLQVGDVSGVLDEINGEAA
ncbi:MAG: hypothetical protein LBG27_14510 [Spirochaetaceae bacterium]|jgi:hypothetical protein|nr:hypothetical protein [Spirochaetaceae bacterium]